MKLDVLISCMYEQDDTIFRKSRITGDAIAVNQCDEDGLREYPTLHGTAKLICSTGRGLTQSRNLAISHSDADVCLLCDNDEEFVEDYSHRILSAYEKLPQADVIIFKMVNRPPSFPDRIQRLRFPQTLRVSSWQISFRREKLLAAGIRFDELLGAGTGNGAEEELKFLLDCQRAGLRIYYVPEEIASVAQTESTWFGGFDEEFFYNRGATTRYILGVPLATVYAIYYVLRKGELYKPQLTAFGALVAIFRGMRDNKIQKQKEQNQ